MVEETAPLKPLDNYRNIPRYEGRPSDQHMPNLADLTVKECPQSDIDVKPFLPQYHYPDINMDVMRNNLDIKPFAVQQNIDDIKPILGECPYPYQYSTMKCERYSPPVSRNIPSQAALPVATSTIRYCGSGLSDEHPGVLKMAPTTHIHMNGSPVEVLCSTNTSPSVTVTTTSPTPPYPHSNKAELKTKETKKGTRRPEKPQISYINLIAKVILDSPGRKLTLSEIYTALKAE